MGNDSGSRRVPVRFLGSVALSTAIAVFMVANVAHAQTWDGGGANDNWGTAANWNPDAAPLNNGTASLIFGGTTRLTPNLDTPWSINSLTFNNTSGPFVFGGSPLTIGTGGITSNDADIQTFNNAIVLNGNQIWTTNAGNLAVNGAISGGFSLTKAGAGTLTLAGTNSATGTTTVSAGTLQINAGGSLTAANQVVVGGAGTPIFHINGGSVTTTNAIGALVVGQAASNPGAFSISSGSFTGSNAAPVTIGNHAAGAYTQTGGAVNIGSGGLYLGNNANGNATVNISGGTLSSATGWLYVGVRAAANMTISGSAAVNFASMNLGHSEGTAVGTRSINLTGGTLTLTNGVAYGLGTHTVNLNGGTLQAGSSSFAWAHNANVTTTIGAAGFTFDSQAFTASINQVLGGTGALTKIGSGTLSLSGANTYTGGTTLNGGTLALGSAGALGSTGTISFGGGTLQHSPLNVINYSSRFSTAAGQQYKVDTNGQLVIWTTPLTSSGGSLTKTGLGILRLTGASTYTGVTTISGGTLQLGNGSTIGSIAGDITNNATLVFNPNGSQTYSGVISGSGSVAKSGFGTITLTGANTYTGGTTISEGTLQLGDNVTNGSVAGNINITTNSMLVFRNATSQTYAGNISGTGSVRKIGTGAMTLTGISTLSTLNNSALTIDGGQLELKDGGQFSNSFGYIGDGASAVGTVSVGGGTGSSTWTNGSELTVGNSGTGTLNITGGGTVTNTTGFVGNLASGQGTVSVGGGTGSSTWNNSSGLTVGYSGTGTLNITGGGTVTNSIGRVGFNTGSQGAVTVGGGIGNSTWTNSGGLTVAHFGTGTLNITGGGAVTNTTGIVGNLASGHVTVGGGTGASTWTSSGELTVAHFGTGTLTITGGGVVANTNGYVGRDGGSQGTVSVGGGTGSSTWTNSGELTVGNTGTGTLSIIGGGVVANTNGYVGRNAGFQGTVMIGGGTGSSTWTNSSDLLVGFSGDGTLNITGGGTVNNVNGQIGSGNNSQGTVTVGGGTGSSTWNNSSELTVGNSGTGTLTITGGGTVTNSIGRVGLNTGSQGAVTVGGGTGSSTWTNSSTLHVGNSGTGTLTITGGGTVNNVIGEIGSGNNSQGTVTVGGGTGNSTWTNSSELYVGSSGAGTLNITGGGTVTNSFGRVGHNAGSQGAVTVGGGTGSSTWNSSNALHVGNSGTGTLTITGGGTVTNTTGGVLGTLASGHGTVTVGGGTGSSTWNNSGGLNVGYFGTGTLNIIGGGTVINTFGANIGLATGSHGTVSVGGGTGSSTWNTSSGLLVGYSGTGTLTIAGGGTVTSAQSAIGTFTGSQGTVSVGGGTGTATWTITGDLYIGGYISAAGGTGALTVTDGGVVTVNGSSKLWSGGSVAVSDGTVDLGTPEFLGGTLNFNAGLLAYTGDLQVGAAGLIAKDSGTGTATLSASTTLGADRQLAVRGTTTIDSFRTLTLTGGTLNTDSLVNNGTLAFNSGTLGITGAGGLTIGTGGPLSGTLTLGTGSNLAVTNMLAVNSGSTLTINGGNASAANLDNSGTTIVSGGGLSVSGAITNQSGGRLFVGNLASFDTPGTLANNAGASIELLGGAARIGGAGALTNSGLILGDGEIVKPVTNAATGEIRAATGDRLLFSAASGANAGKINLQGGAAEFSQALTNANGGLITGRGTLVTGGTGLNNLGSIALSAGITDVFGDVVHNTGNAAIGLQVSGNADVTFWDDVTNTSGLFRVSAGSSATFFGTYAGGGITGTGSTYFEADVTPGFSPAAITLGGDVNFGAAAKLVMELAGTNVGSEYDRITVGGQLALGGVLTISLLDDFEPAGGNSFDILDWQTLSGTFSDIELPELDGDLTWDTDDLYTSGVLSVVAPGIPGDYNDNGTVDAADYVMWRKFNNTETTLPNDSTLGTDDSDHMVWRSNFGNTQQGSGSGINAGGSLVPEPTSLAMLILALGAIAGRRRRL